MQTNSYDGESIKSNNKPAHTWVTPFLITLLIIAQIWFYYRLDKQQKALFQAEAEMFSLQSRLDYVIPLAENANNYAHSHPYSDASLKEGVSPLNGSLDNVLAIHGVRFTWSDKAVSVLNLSDTPQIGFIAQDVERYFPELVSVDSKGYKGVNYTELIPVLFEAIQEQQAMIETLQGQINYINDQP